MRLFDLTRRQFLSTTAGAGALGVLGSAVPLREAFAAGALNVRFDGELDSLDPGYNVGGSPDNDVLWCVNPALVHFAYADGQLTWRPTAYVDTVAQTDPTHIDFTLKPGFQWTNGFGELTAEDVAYSYDRMKTSEWKGFFEAFEKVDVKDTYSGTIVLNQPFAPFTTCGPYLYDWKHAQYVRFKRNPEWTGEQPYFDDINALFVTEDEAAALAYEAGELECTKITSNAYARYLNEPPPNSKITVAGALQYMWMGMNTEHPKLQDIRVRQAIQHAVDVESVIQGAYSGTAEHSYGIVCPGLPGKRNESKFSYDPAKASELLSAAGVSGLELELKTLNNQERVLAAQIIQANLAAVGITVTVLPQDDGPFWDMGQESKGDAWKDLQIWIMRYGAGADPYEPFQWFKRDQVGIWNWERWSDDEFEDLYLKGIAETGAYVWLTHEPEVFIHRDTLQADFAPSGEQQLLYFKNV
jgi:peptide/nickel transport system substrate-binding protein